MTHTDGKRIYAVGDIHGCLDQLNAVLGRIEADLAARPHDDPLLVCVGDYVDRGPDARGVIDRLLAYAETFPTVLLFGNHDEVFLDFLKGRLDTQAAALWQKPSMGGARTLASYGLAPGTSPEAARRAVPEAHYAFLRTAPLFHRVGDYIFVHAGLRPGIPMNRQDPHDLNWIRDPFLTATEPHPGIVVHGHTPVEVACHHGNRIEIDTGAVFGGPLTCLVLEDDTAELLGPEGRAPLSRAGRQRDADDR